MFLLQDNGRVFTRSASITNQIQRNMNAHISVRIVFGYIPVDSGKENVISFDEGFQIKKIIYLLLERIFTGHDGYFLKKKSKGCMSLITFMSPE